MDVQPRWIRCRLPEQTQSGRLQGEFGEAHRTRIESAIVKGRSIDIVEEPAIVLNGMYLLNALVPFLLRHLHLDRLHHLARGDDNARELPSYWLHGGHFVN
jgi:hypothetical protein